MVIPRARHRLINRFRVSWFTAALSLWVLGSCQSSDPIPTVINVDPTTIVAPTLVSIQPTATDQAELIVKAGVEFGPTNWQLTLRDATGRLVPLSSSPVSASALFTLTPYHATGLVSGQTYQLRFDTRNAGGDSTHAERFYIHQPTGPQWVRLQHAPSVGGNFAATALSTDNIPSSDVPSLSVWRYVDEQHWQTMTYYPQMDNWYDYQADNIPSSRLGIVRYRLQSIGSVYYNFNGMGYVTNELLPGQRVYLKDVGGIVPFYGGPDGVIRWFTTLNRAYHLTEGGPTPLWIRQGNWDQYRGPDLPEPTGTLVTFRLGTTGYVVNQRVGQPIHLWAFDTQTEHWSRKADFPGAARSQGAGFTASDKGYFGLGVNAQQQTLRDVWQYEPTTDQWQYVTEYPGAGSTALAVGQVPGHTYLGFGYEHQAFNGAGIRLIGCTDFWEFKAN